MKLEKETARGGKWEFRGGKQVTINGAVNMRAIVSPVRILPTSVGGHLCEFTGRERGDSARGATRNVAPLARGIGRFSQERGSAVPSKVKRTRVTFLCSNFSLQRNEWR